MIIALLRNRNNFTSALGSYWLGVSVRCVNSSILSVVFIIFSILPLGTLNFAKAESSEIPRKLKSLVNVDAYPGPVPSKVDAQWVMGLMQDIKNHFDSAVVLDVGKMRRPFPPFREKVEGLDSDDHGLGYGVVVLASKNQRLYVYGSDLNIIGDTHGVDASTFIRSIELVKKDPKIFTDIDGPSFLRIATSVSVFVSLLIGNSMHNDGYSIWEAGQAASALALCFHVIFYGVRRGLQILEGKVSILNRLSDATTRFTESPIGNNGRFHQIKDWKLNFEYNNLLKTIVDRARKEETCQVRLQSMT